MILVSGFFYIFVFLYKQYATKKNKHKKFFRNC